MATNSVLAGGQSVRFSVISGHSEKVTTANIRPPRQTETIINVHVHVCQDLSTRLSSIFIIHSFPSFSRHWTAVFNISTRANRKIEISFFQSTEANFKGKNIPVYLIFTAMQKKWTAMIMKWLILHEISRVDSANYSVLFLRFLHF